MLENRLVKGIFGKCVKLTENSALPGTHEEKNSATNMLNILTTLCRIIYTDIYGGRGKKGNEKNLREIKRCLTAARGAMHGAALFLCER